MQRYQTVCRHCGLASPWQEDRQKCLDAGSLHLRQVHGRSEAQDLAGFELRQERQCHYCLEPWVDSCTKCSRDFCRVHEGDIHGLCGGCI
jgi:hypothetical protein